MTTCVGPRRCAREDPEAEARELFELLVAFCWRHGTRECYRTWPIARVRDYVRFHVAQGTLAWCRFQTSVIAGVAIAWQDDEAAVRARTRNGGHAFAWQANNPQGDCVVVAEVVCRQPGALRLVIGSLVHRWPHWRDLKIVTFRHGLPVTYRQRMVNLILRKGN